MSGDTALQRRLELIECGIRQLESTADPGLRATAQRLVQSILELHGGALERMLELVYAASAGGAPLVDELGRDPLVGPLLVLHSLHPQPLEARVMHALDTARTSLRATGADVELVSIHEGVVRIRMLGGASEKVIVEQALVDAAPDAVRLDVDGAVESVVGFVPIASLRASDGSTRLLPSALALTPGR
jgi:hypothetical protein